MHPSVPSLGVDPLGGLSPYLTMLPPAPGPKPPGAQQDEEEDGGKEGGRGGGGAEHSSGAAPCEQAVSGVLQSLAELSVVRPGQSVTVREQHNTH